MKIRSTIIILVLISTPALTLFKLDKTKTKKNDGFSINQIYSNHKHRQSWKHELCANISKEHLNSIFSKTFFYLGKGHQSVVFENKEDQVVIKFYKFPSEMREFSFFSHPLSQFSKKRQSIFKYNLSKYHNTIESHCLAFSSYAKESGMLAAQLSKSTDCPYTITLVDRMGRNYFVSLKDTHFILQKKGSRFFDKLNCLLANGNEDDIKKVIHNTFMFIKQRSLQGIIDDDPVLSKNFGLYELQPFQLDTGRLRESSFSISRQDAKQETLKITAALEDWINKNCPQLLNYYLESSKDL
ncbi:MAG: hypothetical protein FJZ57_01705 [Chlamydiae bacterium]|nr:hypothetical protein [Chlamydiota bacterium]